MHLLNIPHPLLLVVGPTAVGKTDFSLQLAERIGAEIISSDSRLFYRGMDVGTAKPSPQELQRVRHHMIDVTSPGETWSLVDFQRAARKAIADIHERDKLPLVVGGTGQYVRALVEDWDVPVQEPDTRLRDTLERWGREISPEQLHAKLSAVDPAAAGRIDPQNLRRTVRALEVLILSGRRFSEQYTRSGSPYSRLVLGLRRPRTELYERIDRRIDSMIVSGWVEEVRGLLDAGYRPELPSFSAIGYREIAAAITGSQTIEEAVMLIKRKTRQFVRRQANWFREADPSIHWFDAESVDLEMVIDLISNPQAWQPPEREEIIVEQ